ncbi:hypothetical protein AGABI1DRAFT_108686 [Agaricus bisporus var. burnettii JB137-S8]|uniref:Uncharacterized protein n=1 Tax=Agaricus bisporus var. burnettii (strain JB137-S8 / ATCC MYA-4627 / FGSC 10392) TaxID=597362 RepID=K5X0J0_AGABU|nr:uncharacterized protein AGABI1DRAFT_108686 [Agaricus bisporus var. burnettii JB137-S8]EKM76608.1 hypothetical protein AGABI1DRAFT_108686 [Agaricus bisporus var. burnettii JB137-S8]
MEMGIDASFVFDKGFIAGLVMLNPVADVLAEKGVFGVCTVELVGEGAEETVAVTEGGCGVETEGTELVVEALRGLCGVTEGEELCAREGEDVVSRKRLTLPLEERVVRALTAAEVRRARCRKRATYAAECVCAGGAPLADGRGPRLCQPLSSHYDPLYYDRSLLPFTMILDHKSSPPPYSPRLPSTPPTLAGLPPHILLHVVYSTFPQSPNIDHGKIERQRKTLLWLVNALRLVNRSFYIACMHVLRSTYLPPYQSLVRPPYSSDPFPSTTAHSRSPTYTQVSSQPIQSLQRETTILDRYIALKVREDVFADDSELHLEREDMFKDLFDHAQPKARLEDLVRRYGVREGVVTVPGAIAQPSPTIREPPPPTSSPPPPPSQSTTSKFMKNLFSRSNQPKLTPFNPPSPPRQIQINPISFSKITISLSPRTIGLIYGSGANKRTLVQLQRAGRNQKLEMEAKALVDELREYLIAEA